MFSKLNGKPPAHKPGVFFYSQPEVQGRDWTISENGHACLDLRNGQRLLDWGVPGFGGNAIAGTQGQAFCKDQLQAVMVHGMGMFLAIPAKPGIKAGQLSIEAVWARPTPESCGSGEGRMLAITPSAHGMRD